MNQQGEYIEVQGTAESQPFSAGHLEGMLALARSGVAQLVEAQRQALAE